MMNGSLPMRSSSLNDASKTSAAPFPSLLFEKTPGAELKSGSTKGVLVPVLEVTVRVTVVFVMPNGIWALICPADTKYNGAASPSMVTVVPAS